MERAHVGTVELEYELQGSGQPLLLIHGAHIADAMRPLGGQDALDQFELIHYHRRGFAGSSRLPGQTLTTEQADDAAGLLDHLSLEQAHIVGHSYGGVIALELAASYPTRVASLVLLEPAVLGGPAGAVFMDVIAPVVERYEAGDPAGAVDDFLALIGPPNWRETIERSVPAGVDQAEKDAATFFEVELPAAAQWSFGPERAAAISCGVLSVLGTESAPLFAEGRELLHEWLRQCEDTDIAGATHLLQMEAPAAVAAAVAAFLQ